MFDAVDDVAEAIGRLSQEPLDVADAALSARLISLAAAAERLQAELIRTTAAWDARMAWTADGARTAQSWIAFHTRTTAGPAARLVRSARHVHRHDLTAKALADGSITVEHVDALARAADEGRDELYTEHEVSLLDFAQRHEPWTFGVLTRRWSSYADDIVGQRHPGADYARRRLHLSPTFRGMGVLQGLFDPEATAIIDSALDAYDHPDPQHGAAPPRTKAQRRADAMVEIVKVALSAKGERGAVVTGADIVVDIETLGGRTPADLTRARRDLDGFGPIARPVIERLLCDSGLRRLLTDAHHVVLNLGRTQYRPTRGQRRALKRTYDRCVFPGCDQPFHHCDVHHLLRYPEGPTDLDNLVPLCRHHHVLTHEGGWRLRRDRATGAMEAVPP
jgi:hypothetical protein